MMLVRYYNVIILHFRFSCEKIKITFKMKVLMTLHEGGNNNNNNNTTTARYMCTLPYNNIINYYCIIIILFNKYSF